MKTIKITYWTVTSIIALMMTYSAYAYLTQPTVQQSFQLLGYPGYFRVELAVAKLIGAIVLLAPVAVRFKEWAYAGFGIVFCSAFTAHLASGQSIGSAMMPLFFLVLLVISYITYHKSHAEKNSITAA